MIDKAPVERKIACSAVLLIGSFRPDHRSWRMVAFPTQPDFEAIPQRRRGKGVPRLRNEDLHGRLIGKYQKKLRETCAGC